MLEASTNVVAPVRDRLATWREVVWSPWKAVVLGLYGVITAAEWARDKWASPELKAKLQFVPNLSWQEWVFGALALLFVVTLEGAYRTVRRHRSESLPSSETDLRDRVRILAAQIKRVYTDAKASLPTIDEWVKSSISSASDFDFDSGVRTSPMMDALTAVTAKIKAVDSGALETYDKFADRVATVTRELRTRGFDSSLIERLETYPTTMSDVGLVASALEEAATRLPANDQRDASSGRVLGPEQQGQITKTIIELLPNREDRAKRTVQVIAIGTDRETRRYAAQFANALKVGGVEVDETFEGNYNTTFARRYLKGVHVRRTDGFDPATHAVLASALNAARVAFSAVPNPPDESDGGTTWRMPVPVRVAGGSGGLGVSQHFEVHLPVQLLIGEP